MGGTFGTGGYFDEERGRGDVWFGMSHHLAFETRPNVDGPFDVYVCCC